MTLEGRLTKDQLGYAMPVDAPLFLKPPIYYRNAESIMVHYETDQDAAADMLPEGLVLPLPAMASLLFVKYPFSTLGSYEETILGIHCTWENEPRFYIPHIVVNNDVPLVAGREVWGYPKKMADISYMREYDMIWGRMERPKGNPICSAGMRPEVQIEEEPAGGGSVGLRVIPSPEEGAAPSLAELISVPSNSTTLELWQGTGWIRYHSDSGIDPWHKLKVKEVLGANFRIYHMELGYGKVVKRY
jgi:acetoacetate decarboxylase